MSEFSEDWGITKNLVSITTYNAIDMIRIVHELSENINNFLADEDSTLR